MTVYAKRHFAKVFLCLLLAMSPLDPARAVTDDPIGDFVKRVLGINDVPTANAIRPTVIPPKSGTKMDATKYYRVDVTCSVDVNTSKLINKGLALNDDTFVAHSLWFSDTATDGTVPPTSTKLINVFSFQKDAGGTISDVPNNACSESFLLPGKNSVLTVSFSLTDTKTLGVLPQILYSAAKMAVGIVPVLFAGPLAKPIGDAAKAAGDTEDPMKAIIGAINQSPRKVAVPTRLVASATSMVIKTAYSKVTLKITPIDDISALISKDNNLRLNFYETIDTIQSSLLQGATTDADVKNRCAKFANLLTEKYSFNKKDSSFLIGYFAQSAFPGDIKSRLGCIGNRYNATDIVDYQFIYNVDTGAAQALSQEDIDNFFPLNGFPRVPLDKQVAWTYTQKLANLLSRYGKSDTAAAPDVKAAAIKWMGAGLISLDDLTTLISADAADMGADALLSKLLAAGFRRYGCFIQNPTVGAGAFDVMMLAFPLNVPAGNPNGAFNLADSIGIRMVLEGTGKPNPNPSAAIKRMQITNETAATLEAANAKSGQCESGIRINLPTPSKQQVAAAR